MTPNEHLFMLMLFGRQSAKFNILYDALTASGAVTVDDLEAYRSYTLHEQPERTREWLNEAWEAYQSIAASLGITTGLEHGPFPQLK